MHGGYARVKEEIHPQLLDLIPNERNWLVKVEDDDHNIEGSKSGHGNGDENKLELRLGPPGVEDYKSPQKAAQKRSAPAPVVGWPPIRSFRKNIATSSSKQAHASDSQKDLVVSNNLIHKEKLVQNRPKGFFVKINMNGIPIGRKVDLNAYDTYEKLCVAVDQLFRGLLAAQNDTSGGRVSGKYEDEKPITGLLDGTGEYTLVYEDNEGDRMLVGDVPWHMFVSSVKRLRVIKSSDISNISRKEENIQV